jgi:hypothetical protein
MARTALASVAPKGPYPGTISSNLLDITFTAMDASNMNTTPFVGNRMLLVWRNSGAGARTITITSVADSHGRTGDVTTFSIGAGEYGAFLVERDGWQQSDGALYTAGEHAEVLLAVLQIP